MYLQKLEVQGFKSFAHKTTFLFSRGQHGSRGLTAIVGPNGSGKSNVADAIRWVLGEQSMKLLRSKKSEDVIFFGSDAKAQLGFCEVALSFNNEDRAFPVDYAEVVIARRLYRSGESEYLINGSKVRLADVTMLLAQGNCGQRSYSVIGQGMIDSIVTMSSAERKHFFDEAAGVRQYQMKKDQAQSKLKTTREHIAQAHMLIAELEPKIKFFARQLKRLEEREVIEHELKQAYQQYYSVAWRTLKEQEASTSAALADLQKTLDIACSHQTLFVQEFQAHQKLNSTDATRHTTQLRDEYEKLSKDRTALVSRLSLVEARLATDYEKQGEANISFIMQHKTDLEAQHARHTTERERSQQEAQFSVERLRALSGELENIERQIAHIQETLLPAASTPGDISLATIHDALDALQKEKHIFFSSELTLHDIQNALKKLFSQLDALQEKIHYSLKGTSQETIQAKQALEKLVHAQREVLVRIQDERIASGVCAHQIKQHDQALYEITAELERMGQELAYFSSKDSGEKTATLRDEQQHVKSQLTALDEKITQHKQTLEASYEEQSKNTSELLRIQQALTEAQKEIDALRVRQTSLSLDAAKREAHQEELLNKMSEELALSEELVQQILQRHFDVSLAGVHSESSPSLPLADVRSRAEQLKRKLDSIGTIDHEALSEYESTKERFEFLTQQAADLVAGINSLERGIAELETSIKERLDHSMGAIEKKFSHYFQQLFSGGNARIVAVKESDFEHEEDQSGHDRQDGEGVQEDEVVGIDISAMPPGKKLKNMSVLSGGEKALTAIALLCAIVSCNPSPFVVLDEVDAALDESNANRFASIIKELGEQTQFIVVTHNRATIHMAQCIYGVTMGEDGVSRVLSLDIAKIDDTLASIKNDS
ncbi:MAG: AAA family ATPase [Patescibacteria group bacterium]